MPQKKTLGKIFDDELPVLCDQLKVVKRIMNVTAWAVEITFPNQIFSKTSFTVPFVNFVLNLPTSAQNADRKIKI